MRATFAEFALSEGRTARHWLAFRAHVDERAVRRRGATFPATGRRFVERVGFWVLFIRAHRQRMVLALQHHTAQIFRAPNRFDLIFCAQRGTSTGREQRRVRTAGGAN